VLAQEPSVATPARKEPTMKQLEVKIMGQSYLLAAPRGASSACRRRWKRVDTAMCKIRDAGKVKARDRIAVLAALNLAFELAERAPAPLPPAAFATPGAPRTGDEGEQAALGALVPAWTRPWARTACSAALIQPHSNATTAYNASVCGACRALYFLEPMLI
jgi:cell division protein ZapA